MFMMLFPTFQSSTHLYSMRAALPTDPETLTPCWPAAQRPHLRMLVPGGGRGTGLNLAFALWVG